MPPESSPGLPDRDGDSTGPGRRLSPLTPDDRASRVRFRRAITLMVMTLLVPGSAQLVAGNRRVGRIALRVWGGLLALGLLVLLTGAVWHGFAFWLGTQSTLLGLFRLLLMALAVGWAVLFMDAWRLGAPLTLRQNHRLAVVGVNGVLCFSVAGTLLFGAHLVGVQRDFLTMFGNGAVSGAHDGRFNVLLMGGDSGAGRWGLRPDSLTVASIDAETGRTVLIGLPRNMAGFPFEKGSVMAEQFPDGFDCDGCYLNGVSTWAEDNTELFPGSEHAGMEATVSAVEGITDLDINYWAMVNLQGFEDLVDAFGGVELNVRDKIPVGLPHEDFFHYIEPGKRKLDGHDTLWFARAREGSDDYSRMARQKCVMNALITQVSPTTAIRNFEKIASASSAMVSTSLPGSELDRFIPLALEAKGQPISTLSLVPPMIDTADPDIDLVHRKVAAAISAAEGKAPAKAKGKAAKKRRVPTSTTGGSLGSLREGYAANQADDLDSAC